MKKVEVKLNRKGVGQLLKSDAVKQMVEGYAHSQGGADTHIKSFVGFDRAKAIIYPNTKDNPK